MPTPSADHSGSARSSSNISARNLEPLASFGEKLATQVARRIEDDIISAGWPVGAVLGSEQALVERYGVSRAVFREAVRIVEHHQVATTRRGPAGGLVVRAPDEAAVATALGVYLERVGVTVESILRARQIVESLAATLAPVRITEEGIGSLRDVLHGQANEDPTELVTHHQLHHAIAAATGNPVLVLFIDVLDSLTLRYAAHEYIANRQSQSPRRRAEIVEEISRDHTAIAEAVIAGDAARAEHLATEHLRSVHQWLNPSASSGTDRPIRSSRPGLRSVALRSAGGAAPSKLAETVAGRIHDDVGRAGLAAGTVIGSESELLARYGVSRSVLREAVRLLEYHSVARMRRGPGGGLVVGQPDPAATIEATALYLEYSRASPEDLRIVRDALELGCIDILVENRDPALIAQLTALLDEESDLGIDTPESTSGSRPTHHVHLALAHLTGNEALAVFIHVLTEVWPLPAMVTPDARAPRTPGGASAAYVNGSARGTSAGRAVRAAAAVYGASVVRESRSVHRGIIQAILDGDRGLARHRMRRHLEALVDPTLPSQRGERSVYQGT